MRYAGELAALGTALCWATGSNLFAAAGRSMGAVILNRLRITTAALLLGLALLVMRGAPWPTWATPEQVGLLAASGLIGYVFGDTYMFRALAILGPGRSTLLASTAPIFTALLGWPLLHEAPGRLALLGMALTIGGICWVLYEREHREHSRVRGSAAQGVLFGVLGALGQAGGYVISKLALRSGLDPLSATMVRIVAAAAGVWLLAIIGGSPGRTLDALKNRRASLFMLGGALFGPVLGVLLSLVALGYIQAGIAASITAIYPIFAILLASRFHGEKITPRIISGALVAVAGVVVLFMR